jgi:hypothetical protein
MTIAMNQAIQQKLLSFDEFLARYGDNNRYELIDGEVFDLEPTGLHEEVAAFITAKICVQIDGTGWPWFVLQRGLLRPSNIGIEVVCQTLNLLRFKTATFALCSWLKRKKLRPSYSIHFSRWSNLVKFGEIA